MEKIGGLILHNLKKDKRQYLSFGIIILLTAFILNLALVLAFQVDKAYDKKSDTLHTADIYFCIPEWQNTDKLKEECLNLEGVEEIESREGIYTSAVIKEFRGVDFTINIIFYNFDESRRFNHYELIEEVEAGNEGAEKFEAPVYIPLFVAEFGEFQIGDDIVYEVNGESYTFQIAGVLEEMQYGNAGSGLMAVYLPEKVFKAFAEEIEENRVAEYSLMIKGDIAETKREIGRMFSDKNINLLSMLDSSSAKQVRTMVCNLTILILMAFSFIILLVSMFLCKFRIQNSIEEEIANMGVLKAIGYTGPMILSAVILPYMLTGMLTALAGILLSYVFLPTLAQMLALQSGFSFLPYFDIAALGLTLLLLSGITLLFTYFAARRIKRLVPIDAIRGNSGGQESSRKILLFIVSFLMMVLAAFAGTLFYNVVIEPEHFASTLSEEMPGIILVTVPERTDQIKKELEVRPQVEKVLEYATGKVEIKNGSVTAFVSEDFSLVNNDLCYEGRNPEKEYEIAIGNALTQDYSIGDKIEVRKGDSVYTYDIVGYIQSVNYQGEVLELTNEGYFNLDNTCQSQSLYLYLKDRADVEKLLQELEKEYGNDVLSLVNYDKMMESAQEMYKGMVDGIIAAIFIVTILIVFLVLYIIIKSLIIRRKQELGIYKAIGYSNVQLIMQIVGSVLPVSMAAILISAVLGLWYMPVINKVLFRMIGAMKNNLQVSLTFLLLFAFVQIAADFIISVCLALPIRKISVCSLIKE